jgi:hypothetical protein
MRSKRCRIVRELPANRRAEVRKCLLAESARAFRAHVIRVRGDQCGFGALEEGDVVCPDT